MYILVKHLLTVSFLFFFFQITIDIKKTNDQPHGNVQVLVTADPSSIVNLLAVDQSVLLMKSGNDITASEVCKFCSYYSYHL